jgi:outer membrane receptor protein involved in Fe transport
MKRSGIHWAPAVTTTNYSSAGGTSIGNRPSGLFKQTAETHDLNVSLSRLTGRHDLKFGWDGRLHRLSFLQPGSPAGRFDFSFTNTSQFPTTGGGDAMASFLMGIGTGGNYEIPARPATQSYQHGIYIQDNWRVTTKLTLNLGLRYDLSVARTERFNHMNYLDPDVASPLKVLGLPNLRGGLVFASSKDRRVNGIDYRNFGPRFGFAYAIQPKLVLRGATESFTILRAMAPPALSLLDSRDSAKRRPGSPRFKPTARRLGSG